MKLGIFTDQRLGAGRYRCVECKAEIVLKQPEDSPVCTVCAGSSWQQVDEGAPFARDIRPAS